MASDKSAEKLPSMQAPKLQSPLPAPTSAALIPSTKLSSPKLSPSGDAPLSSAPPLHTLPPRTDISQLENFALSALAPSMAVVFTLPFDTVKVRMQLQGEVKAITNPTGKTIKAVAEKVG